MEKKKIFKRVLSFLIAASLVNVPIVCANDLPEWAQNAARKTIFWPILADLLAETKKRGGGKTALERQTRTLNTSFNPGSHNNVFHWRQFLSKHNLKEIGVKNCSTSQICETCGIPWCIQLLDLDNNEDRCDCELCLGCLSKCDIDTKKKRISLVEESVCPICGANAKKITLSVKDSTEPGSPISNYAVFWHDEQLILEDATSDPPKYYNVGRPPARGKLCPPNNSAVTGWSLSNGFGLNITATAAATREHTCAVCGADWLSQPVVQVLTTTDGADPKPKEYYCAVCSACGLLGGLGNLKGFASASSLSLVAPPVCHSSTMAPAPRYMVGQTDVVGALSLPGGTPLPVTWPKPWTCSAMTKTQASELALTMV
ncbi:MAG: hypothetical protein LBJ83_03605 [Oscillospiraceae bacterium]|nr:hypothetical protein [Oscillospiraceae bacterium]